jgi:hypothetical protein
MSTDVQINMYVTDSERLYTNVVKQGDTEEPASLMFPKLKVMERQKALLSSYSTSTYFSTLASIKMYQKRTEIILTISRKKIIHITEFRGLGTCTYEKKKT